MIKWIFIIIIGVLLAIIPIISVTHLTMFKTVKKWKLILKNFDKIVYTRKCVGDEYIFQIVQDNKAILRININTYRNNDFFARDNVSDDIIISPDGYFFLKKKIYNKLMELVPEKDKNVKVKDTFENYL